MKAFEIPDADYLAANEWKSQHDATKHTNTPSGGYSGRYTWSFTPSVEKMIIKLTCKCGACIDLTKESKW